MISFIVSVVDRMGSLRACLASLAVQAPPFEIIVCCNSTDDAVNEECERISDSFGGRMLRTGDMGAKSCYESAEIAVHYAKGEWVCFPSDDGLTVEHFSAIMLETAHQSGADLVYCDMVYRQHPNAGSWSPYRVMTVEHRIGRMDKSNFILKRSLFAGFPPHPFDWRDGALIEKLVKDGVRFAKAPGVLVVHQ